MAQLDLIVETLNLSAFYRRDQKTRTGFCERLVTSIGKHGFLKLVKHGPPKHVVQGASNIVNVLFHLPTEEKKLSLHPPNDVPHRGFSPVGMENTGLVTGFGTDEAYRSKVALKDMKETCAMGYEHDPLHNNIYPPASIMPDFESLMKKSWEIQHVVQQDILEAITSVSTYSLRH